MVKPRGRGKGAPPESGGRLGVRLLQPGSQRVLSSTTGSSATGLGGVSAPSPLPSLAYFIPSLPKKPFQTSISLLGARQARPW